MRMRCITNMTAAAIKRSLLLLLALLLAAPSSLAAEKKANSLLLGLISVSTERINPLRNQEREFMSLTHLVYEGLVQIDDDYLPKPALAEKWEMASGGGSWYFTLREGVTFHDGTPLTAQDVVATVNEIKRLAKDETLTDHGPYAALDYFVKAIRASDNLTVVIETSRSNFAFLYQMTFPVLPANQIGADQPAGTGPYLVQNFAPKDFLLLKANQDWWDGLPSLDEIMTIFHSENRNLLSSYEYNRVDAILTRSLTAAQYRSGAASYNLSYRTQQLEVLMMNNKVRELDDVRVRRAIRHAINPDLIVSDTYRDMAARTDTPMPAGTWMYNEGALAYEYNPEKAKALLEEAGWVDGEDEDSVREKQFGEKKGNLKVRFYVYEEADNSVRLNAAYQIRDMLEQVGFQVDVKALPFSQVQESLKAGNFDLCLASFRMDVAPDPGFLLMRGNTGNYGRYQSETMDKLFVQLRSAPIKEEYQSLLYQIQAQFAEDCPFICLYYRRGAILTRTLFTNARDIREPEVLRGVASLNRDKTR